jgi:UDP-N-acetylglucosamine 3-dehydrogenase
MAALNKLRIGLVGCGSFGESHAATLANIPYAEVVAVADINLERASKLASRYCIRKVAKDYRELCELPEVDAVHVVTTEDKHLEPVLAALENGKHVFVEKPMATKVEDAQKMLEAARKTGLILMPGHVCRFETKYATVKERLATGQLGQIVAMSARQNRPKGLAATYKRTHQALVCCVHDIDIMLWYTGTKVKRVRGYEVRVNEGSGPDLTWGVLEFDGGALGFVQTMWLLPDKAQAQDDAMQVITTAGVANINIHSGLSLWTEEGQEIPEISYEPRLRGSVFGALREELSYFALCALEGKKPSVVTPEEGLEAVRTAVALVESAGSGREIEMQ